VKAMQTWSGMLAVSLLSMLVASSCATISTPLTEEQEEEIIQDWDLEWQDMELYRPWRSMDESKDPFKK